MKAKYLVIFIFSAILVLTVYLMLKVENKIREEKIIVIDSTKIKLKLLPESDDKILLNSVKKASIDFKIDGDYFEVLKTRKGKNKKWIPIFLKGVNLGVALPGKFPSEFPTEFQLYMDWLVKIGEMNSNVVRTYTILPPVFYEALADYNLKFSDKPLYLLQGVWATVPKNHDYLNEDYTYDFKSEIKDAIDVIHGNAVLKKKPGKASGVYVSDVSKYTIAYLLGREWEPKGVEITNQSNLIRSFNGEFISVPEGTPMEIWLAKMMNFALKYETLQYRNQHPVSFVNWLPLDPMYHNSEFIENEKVREYDNDLEVVDFRHFNYTSLTKTGIYAAYHAYPYYPDYIYLDKKYSQNTNDNYLPYLEDLKDKCPEMPLIIAEYGVPSSRGISHFSPFGFHQGGHNEKEQAKINKILTEDIYRANCGGAIIFEWIDEWFKFNWLVMDFEQPQHRRKYWHNMENPEQNFGILAMENRTKTIDGKTDDWENSDKKIQADADPSYFYLKYRLPDFDFSRNNLYIAIDTYDKSKGDHKLPFINKNSGKGIEFLMQFVGVDSAEILVDDKYSVFTDIYNDYIPVYASKENSNGKFTEQKLLANRERESLTGEKFPRILYNRSKLAFGNISENSNADWFFNSETKILELRLPWHLLNVSDPSSLQVLDDIAGTPEIETSTTEGFHIFSFITDKNNNIISTIPENKKAFYYVWKGWNEPKYETRLKEQYFVLKNLFSELYPKRKTKKKKVQNGFKITKWYQNKPAAVSITFDDGSYGQYEYAFPILQKYKLKADFGIVGEWTAEEPKITAEKGSFGIKRMGWKQIRELHNTGNEISSHGSKHEKIDPAKSYTEIVSELRKYKNLIQENIGDSVFTIHYPYSFTRQKIFDAVREAGFLFGRIGDSGSPNTSADNLLKLGSKIILNNNDPNPKQFYEWIEDARGNWLVLMYHHIFPKNSKAMKLFEYHNVYNRYSVTPENFEKQVRLLRNSDYWIATTSEVGKYLTEKENVKLKYNFTNDSCLLILESALDRNIYDQPLTIEFTTNWKVVKITHSAKDGIYNARNGKIYFPAFINKKIILEKEQ